MIFAKTYIYVFVILFMVLIIFESYAKYGFNPTDDGFILSGGKYIYDGFIPHKDFVSIRPVGSYFFASLYLLFLSSEQLILYTRLIYLIEVGLISLLLFFIFKKIITFVQSIFVEILLLMILFIFSLNSFPFMLWHTVDGLLLVVFAVYLLLQENHYLRYIGYFVLGLAGIFKQNYLILIPLIMILFKDYKKIKFYIVSLIPLFTYFLVVFFLGGSKDLVMQFFSSSFFDTILVFGINGIILFLFGFILSVCAERFFHKPGLKLVLLCICSLIFLLLADYNFLQFTLFVLGFVVGLTLYCISYKRLQLFYFGVVISLLSGVSSISFGHHYPTFMFGGLVLFIIIYYFELLQEPKTWIFVFLIFYTVSLLLVFHHVRLHNIYRESVFYDLNYNLGDIMPCGRGVYTNYNNYMYLYELYQVTQHLDAENKNYAIIPDFSIFWVCHNNPNTLSINWANNTELNNQSIFKRVVQDLNQNDLYIIIQKYEVWNISNSLDFLTDYKIVNYVKDNYKLLTETEHFMIYRTN